MLTLIASDRPRSAVYMDVQRSRAWTGIVWSGLRRDAHGAHWRLFNDRGVPVLFQNRPLWHMGYFTLFGREWLLLHGRVGASPACREAALRLTRALMDRFDIPAAQVMSSSEAAEKAGLPVEGDSLWDMASFREEL